MAGIGDLVATLGLDSKAFAEGLGSAKLSLSSFVGGIAGLAGPLAGLGAGIGAAFGIKHSIEAAGAQIGAQKRLKAVLDSTGGSAGLSAEQIEEFARSLQKTTNYADETTIAGASVLATFTQIKDADTFKQGIKAAQDLSTIMGQDLQSSIVQVGKALNDPIKGITALRRVGVSFTQDQIASIKNLVAGGDLKGAQAAILKELQTEFGGASEALASPLKQMWNIVGDVAENIGFVLTPSLKVVASAVSEILGPIQEDSDAFKELGQSLASVVSEFVPPLISGIQSAMSWLGEAIGLANQVGQTISFSIRHAADIFQVAGIDMALSLFDLVPGAETVFQSITVTITGHLEGIKAFFGSFVQNILSGFTEIKNVAIAVWAGVKAAFDAGFSGKNPLTAFTEAFTHELANQKDAVTGGNPFEAYKNAYTKSKSEIEEGFQSSGGIGSELKKQREQLLDKIGADEADFQAKAAKKKKEAVKGAGLDSDLEIKSPKGNLKLEGLTAESKAFQEDFVKRLRGDAGDDTAKKQLETMQNAVVQLQTIAKNTDPDEFDEEVVNIGGFATT